MEMRPWGGAEGLGGGGEGGTVIGRSGAEGLRDRRQGIKGGGKFVAITQ